MLIIFGVIHFTAEEALPLPAVDITSIFRLDEDPGDICDVGKFSPHIKLLLGKDALPGVDGSPLKVASFL